MAEKTCDINNSDSLRQGAVHPLCMPGRRHFDFIEMLLTNHKEGTFLDSAINLND